jgi:hypothetical protein
MHDLLSGLDRLGGLGRSMVFRRRSVAGSADVRLPCFDGTAANVRLDPCDMTASDRGISDWVMLRKGLIARPTLTIRSYLTTVAASTSETRTNVSSTLFLRPVVPVDRPDSVEQVRL